MHVLSLWHTQSITCPSFYENQAYNESLFLIFFLEKSVLEMNLVDDQKLRILEV